MLAVLRVDADEEPSLDGGDAPLSPPAGEVGTHRGRTDPSPFEAPGQLLPGEEAVGGEEGLGFHCS